MSPYLVANSVTSQCTFASQSHCTVPTAVFATVNGGLRWFVSSVDRTIPALPFSRLLSMSITLDLSVNRPESLLITRSTPRSSDTPFTSTRFALRLPTNVSPNLSCYYFLKSIPYFIKNMFNNFWKNTYHAYNFIMFWFARNLLSYRSDKLVRTRYTIDIITRYIYVQLFSTVILASADGPLHWCLVTRFIIHNYSLNVRKNSWSVVFPVYGTKQDKKCVVCVYRFVPVSHIISEVYGNMLAISRSIEFVISNVIRLCSLLFI